MLRHLRFLTLCAAVVALATSGSLVIGQTGPVATEFEGLHFRSIGPATMSGRVADFAVLESNPAVYYVATAHGGVWKTTSNGAMFEAQFQDMGLISIGALAMSQTNPDLVWAGTGESNNRQSTSWGDGVYKSTDGGKTWRNMGLRESRHINRIVIDPRGQQHRVRRRDRSALRTGRRPRPVQDHRRRRDLEAGAQGRRRHRRERRRAGGDGSPDALRLDLPAPARAVLHERRRPGQRHLEIDGPRRDVDAPHDRPASRIAGPHRTRRVPPQREHRLRDD